MVRQLKRRAVPLIGGGGGWWSLIHIDDAASATAAAIEAGAAGVFNVVDDEPAPVRAWLPALAEAVGAKPSAKIPPWIARLLAGDALVTMMTEARAGSNAKIKRELSWAPPSLRGGRGSRGRSGGRRLGEGGQQEARRCPIDSQPTPTNARLTAPPASLARYAIAGSPPRRRTALSPCVRWAGVAAPAKTDWRLSFVTDGRSRKAVEIRRTGKATLVFQRERGRLCVADGVSAAVGKPC